MAINHQTISQMCADLGKDPLLVQGAGGNVSWKENEDFLEELKNYKDLYPIWGLTYLGYKDFGFAQNKPAHEFPVNWIDILEEFNKKTYIKIGVDSIIVNKYREQLLSAGIKSHFLVGKEGKQTCYVDAVTMKIQPSSFTMEAYDFPVVKDRLGSYSNYEYLVKSTKDAFLQVWNKF